MLFEVVILEVSELGKREFFSGPHFVEESDYSKAAERMKVLGHGGVGKEMLIRLFAPLQPVNREPNMFSQFTLRMANEATRTAAMRTVGSPNVLRFDGAAQLCPQ